MDILSIIIERADRTSYCGVVTYQDTQGEGSLLWTVELTGTTKVVVGFVQGDRIDWLDTVQEHAHYLSDNIILAITRHSKQVTIQS